MLQVSISSQSPLIAFFAKMITNVLSGIFEVSDTTALLGRCDHNIGHSSFPIVLPLGLLLVELRLQLDAFHLHSKVDPMVSLT